jgi:hypothetical protein
MAQPSVSSTSARSPRERLSWAQICARHPDQWVVLINVEYQDGDEDNGDLVAAEVIGHDKTRGGSFREADPILDGEDIRRFSHLFTGKIVAPPGFAVGRM